MIFFDFIFDNEAAKVTLFPERINLKEWTALIDWVLLTLLQVTIVLLSHFAAALLLQFILIFVELLFW